MCEKKYNGWTNYETWLLALNLNNSSGTQSIVTGYANDYDNYVDFKEALEEALYDEETQIYKVEDRWLERDWNEINFYEVWQSFKDVV